jgi:hypothetical protein
VRRQVGERREGVCKRIASGQIEKLIEKVRIRKLKRSQKEHAALGDVVVLTIGVMKRSSNGIYMWTKEQQAHAQQELTFLA